MNQCVLDLFTRDSPPPKFLVSSLLLLLFSFPFSSKEYSYSYSVEQQEFDIAVEANESPHKSFNKFQLSLTNFFFYQNYNTHLNDN